MAHQTPTSIRVCIVIQKVSRHLERYWLQEVALAAALELHGTSRHRGSGRIVVLAAGTDGTDGPTDATGALVDDQCLVRANAADAAQVALAEHNAYTFFDAHMPGARLGHKEGDAGAQADCAGLLRTGPTGTNVMDVTIAFVA